MECLDYYGDVEYFERYLWDAEEGKKRLKEFERVYEKIKDFLEGNIVEIGCGAGLFTFFLEEKGHSVMGVEVNRKMADLFENVKRKHGFKSELIVSDAESAFLEGSYRTAVFVGNTIWHFSAKKLMNTVRNLENYGVRTFVFHYRSLVKILFNKEWKDALPVGRSIAVTEEYNDEEGYIQSVYFDTELEKRPIREKMFVWAPFILEALMGALGYKLLLREEVPADMCEILEVYRKRCPKIQA